MTVRVRGLLGAVAMVAFGMGGVGLAAGMGGTGGGGVSGVNRTNRDNKDAKSTRWIVAQCKSIDAQVTFEALAMEKLKDRVKECREQYDEAVKAWRAAAIEAKKNHEKFTEKPPTEPYVVKFSRSPVFKAEEEAKTFADKVQEAWDKKMAEKAANGEQKPDAEHKADGEKKVEGAK